MVLIDEINFIRDSNYYFKVRDNTIHGRELFTFSFYHELAHYKMHKNIYFRKVSSFFSWFVQGVAHAYMIILSLTIAKLIPLETLQHFLFIVFLPIALFINMEEFCADMYAMFIKLKIIKKPRLQIKIIEGET